MRIAITGAQGYLGGHLEKRLAALGAHQVRGFALLPPVGENQAMLDVCDAEQCLAEIKNFDILYHKVGLMGCNLSHQDPSRYYQVNIGGTLNILKACKAGGIKKIVFDSTESVFGPGNHAPLREESQPQPASFYAASKYIAEQYIASFCRQAGIKFAIMRYPRVVGTDSKMVVNTLIAKALNRDTVVIADQGKYRFDLVHVADVIDANLAVLQAFDAQGIFHVSGEEPLSCIDICNLIEKTLDLPIRRSACEAPDTSDGRFLANPLQLVGTRLGQETGFHRQYTSSQAVCSIAALARR